MHKISVALALVRVRQQKIRVVLLQNERPLGYICLKQQRVLPALYRAEQKVIEGSYGICDDCSELIGEERLKAARGAICCVTCQQERDKKSPLIYS